MAEKTLREVLNGLRWGAGADAVVVDVGYVERGEEGERVEVTRFGDVLEILPGGVTLAGGTFIPYHRVRFVRRGAEALWRPRERGESDEG